MRDKFRILIIDDNKEVLDRLKSIVQRDAKAKDFSIRIEVETLHVEMVQIDSNNYKISKKTIINLGRCSEGKFDYIFSDFAFLGDVNKSNQLRQQLLDEGRGVKREDLEGNVLKLADIKTAFEEMGDSDIPAPEQEKINSYFFGHTGRVIIYTNSPEPYSNYFESREMPIRIGEVKDVFPEVTEAPQFILMHEEFGITPTMETALGREKLKQEYIPLWFGNYIDRELQIAAFRQMVDAQSKLRFKNTRKAFLILTAIGTGFGALVALFGEVIFHFLYKSFEIGMKVLDLEIKESVWLNIFGAIAIILLAFVIFPILGVFVAKLTELKIDDLLEK